MEQSIAMSTRLEDRAPYIRGDVFLLDDHTFSLVFGDSESLFTGIRAGIIYEPHVTEPSRKLDAFCQTVSDCLIEALNEITGSHEGRAEDLRKWRQEQSVAQTGFERFVTRQDNDSLYTVVRKENSRERVRAAELLENSSARAFLRNAKQAYTEGYAAKLLAESTTQPAFFSLGRLVEVGLLRQEVLISCRQTGHTLLSLPSSAALAVITVSDATCTECGARIADEKIEEVVAPTHLSSALLDDGTWLVNRLHSMLRKMGIAESEIAIEPPEGTGEAYMMANVCSEPFLFALRDGDLTPAFARRIVDMQIETDAAHLMIVATGTIHNEGRTHLLNYASRMVRGGREFELIIVDGAESAATELRYALERVSKKAIAEQLCELNTSLGFSVARLVSARFEMLHKSRETDAPAQLTPAKETAASLRHNEHTASLITFPVAKEESEVELQTPQRLIREHS
jgi:C4-type Zn-finger protein